MAVKELTTGINTPKNYFNEPHTPGELATVFEAPSVAADGVQFTSTGRELVLVRNTTGTPGTITIVSARDEYGRTGDLTAYSIAANSMAILPLKSDKLFKNSVTGKILITMSALTIEVAVVKLPNAL